MVRNCIVESPVECAHVDRLPSNAFIASFEESAPGSEFKTADVGLKPRFSEIGKKVQPNINNFLFVHLSASITRRLSNENRTKMQHKKLYTKKTKTFFSQNELDLS